ncbi:MAG TPA: GIY-YIG nuclease family protein [Microbacteriaceae bacterium]|nr:GIY-YIG nuclease family protein [Microbacteriaceae bacterium]
MGGNDGDTELSGALTLGHLLAIAEIDRPADLVLIRHSLSPGGLAADEITPARVLAYTREQALRNKLGPAPAGTWLVFLADGARRARFYAAYENRGEVLAERTQTHRFFDLKSSDLLSSLQRRLVVEWTKDTINWAKSGAMASQLPVVEIADPAAVAFPGYDRVLVTYDELRAIVDDSRYAEWRTALAAVQGVYLITDPTGPGRLYVGKADGLGGILARWAAYARDGHGGNVALRDLAGLDAAHAKRFRFSILRVFGPHVPQIDVDDAEAHYKRALLTREHGLNRN